MSRSHEKSRGRRMDPALRGRMHVPSPKHRLCLFHRAPMAHGVQSPCLKPESAGALHSVTFSCPLAVRNANSQFQCSGFAISRAGSFRNSAGFIFPLRPDSDGTPICLSRVGRAPYSAPMSCSERITVDPAIRSGKPIIRGTRITVVDILEYLAGGMTSEGILADFPELTAEDICAVRWFAAERERRLFAAA